MIVPTVRLFFNRVCAGKRFAEQTLFIAVVSLLATFKVTKAKDETGKDIDPVFEVPNSALRFVLLRAPSRHQFAFIDDVGSSSLPKPFTFTITPRSDKVKEMILSFEDEVLDRKSDAKELMEATLD